MKQAELKKFNEMSGAASQEAVNAILKSEVVKTYGHLLSETALEDAKAGLMSPDELLQHINLYVPNNGLPF